MTVDDLESTDSKTTDQAHAPEPRPLSERDLAMEEIAKRTTDARLRELGEEPAHDAPKPDPAPEPDPDIDPEDKRAAPEPEEVVIDSTDLSRYKVRAKIDGVEEIVTLDQAMRQFQKNGAADKRLAEATRLLKEAQETVKQKEIIPESAPTFDESGADEEFIDSLFEGDKEKSKQALRKLVSSRQQQPSFDTEKFMQEIVPTVKQQLSIENALDRFRKDNADIVDDPYLTTITERFWQEEIDSGKDQAAALEDAGKRTRDWLTAKGVSSTRTSTTMSREEKLERKRAMDSLPATSARATTPEEVPMSTSDVIADMRRKRGFD